MKSSLLKDKFGNIIHENEHILYLGNTYTILYIEKENKWIAHPDGNSQVTTEYNLSDICYDCEII